MLNRIFSPVTHPALGQVQSSTQPIVTVRLATVIGTLFAPVAVRTPAFAATPSCTAFAATPSCTAFAATPSCTAFAATPSCTAFAATPSCTACAALSSSLSRLRCCCLTGHGCACRECYVGADCEHYVGAGCSTWATDSGSSHDCSTHDEPLQVPLPLSNRLNFAS